MEDLRVESAAHVLVSQALLSALAMYQRLRDEHLPPEHPLDDEEAAALGGAVLLCGLYCRLLELEHPEPLEAMERAFTVLESDPELDPALVAAIKERYDAMDSYKVFRSDATVLEFIGERAWHVAYPNEEVENPSAFQGYVEALVEDSYGRLQEWNLV